MYLYKEGIYRRRAVFVSYFKITSALDGTVLVRRIVLNDFKWPLPGYVNILVWSVKLLLKGGTCLCDLCVDVGIYALREYLIEKIDGPLLVRSCREIGIKLKPDFFHQQSQ